MSDSSGVEAVNGQGIAKKAQEVANLAAGSGYKLGGKTTDGFDCSGFVSFVFKELYPNKSWVLNVAGYKSSDQFIDVADPQAGDIIIFPGEGGSSDHMGIVIDATSWIGSQSSTGVAIVLFSNLYWSKRSKKFRRLKILSTASLNMGRGVASSTNLA